MLLTLSEVYGLLREAIRAAGGQTAFARDHGLSPGYLSDVMNARRDPGASIQKALGITKVTRYKFVENVKKED